MTAHPTATVSRDGLYRNDPRLNHHEEEEWVQRDEDGELFVHLLGPYDPSNGKKKAGNGKPWTKSMATGSRRILEQVLDDAEKKKEKDPTSVLVSSKTTLILFPFASYTLLLTPFSQSATNNGTAVDDDIQTALDRLTMTQIEADMEKVKSAQEQRERDAKIQDAIRKNEMDKVKAAQEQREREAEQREREAKTQEVILEMKYDMAKSDVLTSQKMNELALTQANFGQRLSNVELQLCTQSARKHPRPVPTGQGEKAPVLLSPAPP